MSKSGKHKTYGMSHLLEYKFKHSCEDAINPLCNCSYKNETIVHLFFYCSLFTNERDTFFNTLRNLDND